MAEVSPSFTADAALAGLARPAGARPPPLEAAVVARTEAEARRRTADGLDAAGLNALVAAVIALAEAAWAETRADPAFLTGRRPAACRKGCGWCCHQAVGAAEAEVLALAAWLREAWPDGRRAELAARLAAPRGTATPCPFLDQGACAIYEHRPLKCRGLYHVDERHCMRAYARLALPLAVSLEGPPPPDFQAEPKQIFDGAVMGLVIGLRRAGLASGGVELTAALAAVLDDEAAAGRWLKGRPVFPRQAQVDWLPLARPQPPSRTRNRA
jgi:hypothetical protein